MKYQGIKTMDAVARLDDAIAIQILHQPPRQRMCATGKHAAVVQYNDRRGEKGKAHFLITPLSRAESRLSPYRTEAERECLCRKVLTRNENDL